MRISLAYDIDSDIDAFCRSYWDEEFIRAKFAAQDASSVAVTIESTDEGFRVTTRREVPMDAPAALQAVIGERSEVEQIEEWSGEAGGPYHCQIEVKPQGVPAEAKGEIIVTATPDGCRLECETDAICTMPLVGRMAEKFMARDIEKRLDEEVDYIEANA